MDPARYYLPLLLIAIFFASAPTFVTAQDDTAAPIHVVEALETTLAGVIAHAESSVVAVSRVHVIHPHHLEVPSDGLSLLRGNRTAADPSDPSFIPSAFGAGVVIDALGLILTHAELVREGDIHWVTTVHRKSYAAQIIGADPRCGLAVLSIQASGLTPIRLGDASRLVRGQFIVAMGNPFSLARDGQSSASFGIVANTGRKARFGDANGRTLIQEYGGLIQTDAKLDLGTSGGPILNMRGEMVGLTTTLSAGPGFDAAAGYAIPVDLLFRRALETLRKGREVEYGLLGVHFWPPSRGGATAGGGVRIIESLPGGPAYRAGLRSNDVITHVNDAPIASSDALVHQIGRLAPSALANVRFTHRASQRNVDVELGKSPVRWSPVVTQWEPAWRGIRVDYATAIENFGQLTRNGLVDERGCVVVRSVEKESIAWRAGLREGMIISHIAGKRISRPDQFSAAVARRSGPIEIRTTLPENQRPVRVLPDDA